jgi:hypothetical protein
LLACLIVAPQRGYDELYVVRAFRTVGLAI